MRRIFPICLALFLCLNLAAKERDPDLFNTFYLDGAKPTWILTIKPKNLYSLIGPDGTYYEGWYNSSGEEIGLNFGNNPNPPFRHFEYKIDDDGNLKLNPTKKDMLNDGQAQGAMPPTKRGKSVKFISKQNWIAEGRDEGPINVVRAPAVADATPPPLAPPVQQPVVPIIPSNTNNEQITVVTPIPPPAVPTIPPPQLPAVQPGAAPIKNPGAIGNMAGKYEFKPSATVTETFLLTAQGGFEYSDSQGSKAAGQAAVENGLLVLRSGQETRMFNFEITPIGTLSLTRNAQDAPKFTNDLAYMSPSVAKVAQYTKQGIAGDAVAKVAVPPPPLLPGAAPYDEATLKAVQAGQTAQALQQTTAALQANPTDQKLAKQKIDLESLMGVENLYSTLRGMYGQAQRAIDSMNNPNAPDEIAAKAGTYLKEHQSACDAGIARARALFVAGQSDNLPASVTDVKNLAAESAEAFSKLSAYYAQKATAAAPNASSEVLKNLAGQAASLSQK